MLPERARSSAVAIRFTPTRTPARLLPTETSLPASIRLSARAMEIR
jgi:hypothetical protein